MTAYPSAGEARNRVPLGLEAHRADPDCLASAGGRRRLSQADAMAEGRTLALSRTTPRTFTLPRMLRPYLLRNRELLGRLYQAACETVQELMAEAASGVDGFRTGMVGSFAGGYTPTHAPEEYDPTTDVWTRRADMPTPRGWRDRRLLFRRHERAGWRDAWRRGLAAGRGVC